MDVSQNQEKIIIQTKNVWAEMTQTHPEDFNTKLFDEKLMNLLSENSNTVIAVISLKGYRKLYMSKNVKEIWGYSFENNPNLGILQFIKMMSFHHAFFPLIAAKWYLKCLNSVIHEEKTNQKIAFVGAQFRTN